MTVKHWNTGAAAARFRSQAASVKRQASSIKPQASSIKHQASSWVGPPIIKPPTLSRKKFK